jgi:CubicO group peptidase (beta-lactamase class C family)
MMPRHRAIAWSLAVAALSLGCTSCLFSRILYFNLPTLAAPTYFDERVVRPSSRPAPFARQAHPAAFALRHSRRATFATFEDLLERNDTRAFLVLRHDVIAYERYFGAVTAETRLPAFSMSKTFAALLVGCAERDGLIASAEQRLVAFVPALAAKPGYGDVTLAHLLRMTAGIDFEEESAAGPMFYYTTDLRSRTIAYDIKWLPGRHYQYGSVSTQLLWEVLHERLRGRTVASYFEERVWESLGAERSAAWALDSAEHGVEKLSSGLSATTRDYARLGVLFQHAGRYRGRRVISERWAEESLAADEVPGIVHTTDGAVRRGRYQWFRTLDGCCYFAKGYNGQYVFVHRALDVVIVRFGEGYGDVDWTALFSRVAESLAGPEAPSTHAPGAVALAGDP